MEQKGGRQITKISVGPIGKATSYIDNYYPPSVLEEPINEQLRPTSRPRDTTTTPIRLLAIVGRRRTIEHTDCGSYADLDCDGDNITMRIRDLCGLFVYITGSRVYLIHQTAKEFLLKKEVDSSSAANSWRFSREEKVSETIMTKICIGYLLITDFGGPYSSKDKEIKGLEYERAVSSQGEPSEGSEYDFMDYAAMNWASHFRKAQIDERSFLLQSSLTLYETSSRRFQIWFQRYWKIDKPFERQHRKVISLHVAALNGHEAVVRLLLATKAVNTDAKDDFGETPLWWAADQGHEAVVRLLLARGAVSADTKNDVGETPLWRAADQGHEAVVRLLLAKEAVNADMKDDFGETPLWRAADQGYEVVVRLLLATGAVNTDVKDDFGETPLWRAAGQGHEAVVRLLLATGAGSAEHRCRGRRTKGMRR